MSQARAVFGSTLFVLVFSLCACDRSSPNLHRTSQLGRVDADSDNDSDESPLKLVGERLFRETRFSQYFYANYQGGVNQPLANGDKVTDQLVGFNGFLAHPYKGQSINCASCHFVEQNQSTPGGGQRAYTDFARQSPVPERADGLQTTPRNAPNMVGSATNSDFFLHHDGEFGSAKDLAKGALAGRNMGWLPHEAAQAKAHIVAVIRGDDGSFPTDPDWQGYSYRQLFTASPQLPPRLKLPPAQQFDIDKATDEEVFDYAAELMAGYMAKIDFKRDRNGFYIGSPFDVFLQINGLPRAPALGESSEAYTKKLAKLLSASTNWRWVDDSVNKFALHQQKFVFSEAELRGFQTFAGQANCAACHGAPDFTDHGFHNTGVAQLDYDDIHGKGKFAQLKIPSLTERRKNPARYLPASASLPQGSGVFRTPPSASDGKLADLGVWNIFANPDMPAVQIRMREAICLAVGISNCKAQGDEGLLALSVGMIKTPTLRDLGHSAPYFHTGRLDSLDEVLQFYLKYSQLALNGQVVNSDPRLKDIRLKSTELDDLRKFLFSLNEDYQ